MTRHLIAEGWTQMLVGLDQALDVISSPQTHCHCSSDPEKAVFQACQPASDSAWHDTFAPKLDPSIIKQLKKQLEQDFLKNYPSEILTPETMPSTRLLSLVHKHVKNPFPEPRRDPTWTQRVTKKLWNKIHAYICV